MRAIVALLVGFSMAMLGSSAWSADVQEQLQHLRAAAAEPAGSLKARRAWDHISAQGPEALPLILKAMDSPDAVINNWLRSAFDAIVERESKKGWKTFPVESLFTVLNDRSAQGKARRLALELLERMQPGTQSRFVASWIDDPEFRFEGVEYTVARAMERSDREQQRGLLKLAFQHARDAEQVKSIATKLKAIGEAPDILAHLGFFATWQVIGPFDAKNMSGFKNSYPPETKVDLSAELDGKAGKVRWKRIQTPETGLVNLLKELGQAEDAVGYAHAAFDVPAPTEVEFRGAADDNLTVWVNGQRAFGFEEYRNGVRLDRHRFKVKLKQGTNTVLVKVCQSPLDPTNPETNWEFLFRMVDATGRGFGFKSVEPAK